MDQFAQSREDDDLFGDDFEPVSAPTIVEDTPAPVIDSYVSTGGERSQDVGRNGSTQDYRRDQGRGRGAQRGRGRGRGAQNAGLAGSRYAPQGASQEKTDTSVAVQAAPHLTQHDAANNAIDAIETSNSTSTDTIPSEEPTTTAQPTDNTNPEQAQPLTQTLEKPRAVRGDRSLTGGPTHVKLSEAELSEKMAKMAILNAKKAERFRLSEADSAAFLQKEAEMKKKRVEEMKNAREMDKERAKNRERKLKAQGGREWDSEKLESDIVDGRGRGRSSEYVRGGHGGVIRGGGLGGSRFADDEPEVGGYQGSRGRGGFEIRGRGNRGGRGGRGGKSTPAVPTPEDFPSLPPAAAAAKSPKAETTTTSTPVKETSAAEAVTSPGFEKGHPDWAEEMATPVEEKKLDL